jgi:hypothetical protein
LALGGDGLREATAAIDDNLIATQKSIDATREYEVMMDTFQDTAKGVGNTLATAVIPPLTTMGNSFNAMMTDNQRVNMVMDTYQSLIKAGILTRDSFNDALKLHGVTADGTEKGFAKLEETVMAYLKQIADLDAIHAMDKGERDMTDSTNNLAIAFDTTLASAISDAREDMGGMTDNEIAAQIVGLQGLKKAAEEYSTALSSVTTSGIEQFTEGMGEAMRAQALLTYWQTINAIPANDANAEALKRVALETYQASLANSSLIGNIEKLTAGLEPGTVTVLEWNAAMADGIVTNEELEAAMAPTTAEALALATNVGLATGALHDMDGTTANTYINHYDITHYSEHRDPTGPGQEPGGPHSKGADYIVPPGYSGDNYPLGFAQSGERVVIIPKNQQGNTTNNFNMNVHTNAQTSSVMGDFNKMRAWAK